MIPKSVPNSVSRSQENSAFTGLWQTTTRRLRTELAMMRTATSVSAGKLGPKMIQHIWSAYSRKYLGMSVLFAAMTILTVSAWPARTT